MYKFLKRLIGHLAYFTVFGTIFMGSLLITYGYRYDFKENTLVETGVIDICAEQEDAGIWLDAEKQEGGACLTLRGVDLGAHTLEIKKPGYLTWYKKLWVNNSRVNVLRGVALLPRPEFYTAEAAPADGMAPNDSLDFVISNHELWLRNDKEDRLVTRWAEPIESANYFYNHSNLIIATANAVTICYKDGENCHEIMQKDEHTEVLHELGSHNLTVTLKGEKILIRLKAPVAGGIYEPVEI